VVYPQAPSAQPTPSPSAYQEPASDSYLASVSDASRDVLQYFGPEAPALLNHYATVVEDALLRQTQQTLELTNMAQGLQHNLRNAHTLITAAAEDNAAYHTILSNPELLGSYVQEFFGPGGVAPLEPEGQASADDPRSRLAAEVEYGERTGQFSPRGVTPLQLAPPQGQPPLAPVQAVQYQPQQPQFQAQEAQPQAQPQGYQRPQLDVQGPGQAPSGGEANEFWQTFSHLMDVAPAQAAQFFYKNGTPQMLQGRVFMGEG
jgi:hypothetical protein